MTLNVTDNEGNWNTDTMNITVKDVTSPIAKAGSDQTVKQGDIVIFNGSASSDNVGIVNWTWTFTINGSQVKLYGVLPTYRINNPGAYMVTLNVTDAGGNWNTDTTNITVIDITKPEANAGSSRLVPIGSTLEYSTDPHLRIM